MMSINRYRLRHMVRKKHRAAKRVAKLLERTDKLLGVILIGNTFANLFASSIATLIAYRLAGEWGTLIATLLLSVIILVFAEVTPKTLAAAYPLRFSFIVSLPLKILLIIFYPLVWIVNVIVNSLLRVFGVKSQGKVLEQLSGDELRTVVKEAGSQIHDSHQDMLVRILDLEKMTVEDVMIPRHEIEGIELDNDWDAISWQLTHSKHTRLPLYQSEIDEVQGMLNLRKAMPHLSDQTFSKEKLAKLVEEVYFVPEGTPLTTQLLNFRRERKRIALVVDEYGEILGLVTIEDIVEEIVGELASEVPSVSKWVQDLGNGRYRVAGNASIRELNRLLNWELPLDGPKTLSGLIIEYLEAIPVPQSCLKLNNYPMEIITVEENMVKEVIVQASAIAS